MNTNVCSHDEHKVKFTKISVVLCLSCYLSYLFTQGLFEVSADLIFVRICNNSDGKK